VASNTVKAMTSPCAVLSRAVVGGSSGFCGAGGGGWWAAGGSLWGVRAALRLALLRLVA